MRTTIRLPDELLKRTKKRAAEESRTLTSMVEEGLTLLLARPVKRRQRRVKVPVSRAKGGLHAGVDLNRSADVEGFMEDA